MKRDIPKWFVLLWAICSITMFYSCEEVNYDNPLDPSNPDYIHPETIIDLLDEVIETSSVTITWQPGENVLEELEYKHRFNNEEWATNWDSVTFFFRDGLTEGSYEFHVKSRYKASGHEEGEPAQIGFEVIYERPLTTITVSEIVFNSFVTINWGASPAKPGTEYQYNFDNVGWSEDWSSDTSATFDYLDEGNHTIQVKARYDSLIVESSPAEESFEVNAIDGPSFRVSPLRQEVYLYESFSVEVIAEEVQGIRYFECIIEYDPQKINYSSNQHGEFFTNADLFFVDNETPGTVTISAGAISNSNGYTGTGSIIELSFSANDVTNPSGTQITITTESAYFDVDGNEIVVNQRKEGLVVIQ